MQLAGMLGMGWQLDSMIFVLFSNLSDYDSMKHLQPLWLQSTKPGQKCFIAVLSSVMCDEEQLQGSFLKSSAIFHPLSAKVRQPRGNGLQIIT